MPSSKPVQITLYHANWCGHCVNFKPTWETMKSNPKNTKKIDFVSRFFAPTIGIDEDSVTGSTHASLAPYWGNVLNKKKLVAKQISKRGGELDCEVLSDRIKIGGRAKLYLKGFIEIN